MLVIKTRSEDYREVTRDIDSLTRQLEKITGEYLMDGSHEKIVEIRKKEIKKMFDSLLD